MERSVAIESERIIELQTKFQEIMAEVENLDSKSEFFEGIKNVVDIKRWLIELELTDESNKNKLDEFEEVCLAISQSKFERMEVSSAGERDIFSHLANCINTISKELELSTTRKYYLEETMEHLTDLVIITDKKGIIRFVNSKACELLNQTKENLINLRIANIFENKTQSGSKVWFGKSFQNLAVKIMPYNSNGKKVPVYLTLKELIDPRTEIADGYLYIAKEIGV